jgi:hypothetical protein
MILTPFMTSYSLRAGKRPGMNVVQKAPASKPAKPAKPSADFGYSRASVQSFAPRVRQILNPWNMTTGEPHLVRDTIREKVRPLLVELVENSYEANHFLVIWSITSQPPATANPMQEITRHVSHSRDGRRRSSIRL